MRSYIGVLLLVAVLGATGASPSPAAPMELIGEVGPEPTISVKDTSGDLILVLDPGTYTFTIRDHAENHNFRLFGPDVNQATAVERLETVVWSVTLSEGRYTYSCDPHAAIMRGTIRVRAATPPPPATLFATVGPGKAASLKSAEGTAVESLAAGSYAVVVRDRSARQSFRLVGKGLSRSSGSRFKGTVRWRVTFRAGVYRYWSSPAGKRRSFRVS